MHVSALTTRTTRLSADDVAVARLDLGFRLKERHVPEGYRKRYDVVASADGIVAEYDGDIAGYAGLTRYTVRTANPPELAGQRARASVQPARLHRPKK